MGYLPKRKILEENLLLLQSLLFHVNKGETLTLSFPPEDLGSAHYRLNRLLNAAQVFHDFEEGVFTSLRTSLTFKVDAPSSTIKAVPLQHPYTPVRHTYLDALRELEEDKTSSIKMIEFFPSPSPNEFDPHTSTDDLKSLYLQCAERGWTLHAKAVMHEEETGLISIGVSRFEKEKTSGFDALRQATSPFEEKESPPKS